jgi:hypothetical protein
MNTDLDKIIGVFEIKPIKTDYPQLKGFTDIEGILCLSVLIAGGKIKYDSNIEQVAYYNKNVINYDCSNCDLKDKCLACIINE